ncbi:MAG: hypothetical protein KDE68_12930 [Rhodocyclaceae bacterium]|nr:hypothetical protein [Rhodocyclaceae bacterium]
MKLFDVDYRRIPMCLACLAAVVLPQAAMANKCAPIDGPSVIHDNSMGVPSVRLNFPHFEGETLCHQQRLQRCASNGLWVDMGACEGEDVKPDEPDLGKGESPQSGNQGSGDGNSNSDFANSDGGFRGGFDGSGDPLNSDFNHALEGNPDWFSDSNGSNPGAGGGDRSRAMPPSRNFQRGNQANSENLSCEAAVQRYCSGMQGLSQPNMSRGFCASYPAYVQFINRGISLNQQCAQALAQRNYASCSSLLTAQINEYRNHLVQAERSYRGMCN